MECRGLSERRSIVFQAGDYGTAGLWAYDPVRGTHPLLTYPGDHLHGAINVGTDGKDLVWDVRGGQERPGHLPREFDHDCAVHDGPRGPRTSPAALGWQRGYRDVHQPIRRRLRLCRTLAA